MENQRPHAENRRQNKKGHQRRMEERYLKYINADVIASSHNNITYYEQLADTIKNDIMSTASSNIIKENGAEIDLPVVNKLRRQMEQKLKETLIKLS